jgi:hypothetical protein
MHLKKRPEMVKETGFYIGTIRLSTPPWSSKFEKEPRAIQVVPPPPPHSQDLAQAEYFLFRKVKTSSWPPPIPGDHQVIPEHEFLDAFRP